jgi:hypothetical protein
MSKKSTTSKATKLTKKDIDSNEDKSPREKQVKDPIPSKISTEIYVRLGDPDFEWKKVIIQTPKMNKSAKGEWYTSFVHYKLGSQFLPIYFGLNKQIMFINRKWPYGVVEQNQTLSNFDGYQICYNLTTSETVKTPTEKEAQTIKIFDKIWDTTLEHALAFCKVDRKDRKIPDYTYTSFLGRKEDAKSEGRDPNWKEFIKPTYAYTTSTDEKTKQKFVDKSKPLRAYIEFVTKGVGEKLTCDTEIFGPGDKPKSPDFYVSTKTKSCRVEGTPIVFWQDIFWGDHKSTYGGSARLRVKELNVVPMKSGTLASRRMGEKNEAPEISGEEPDKEGADFQDPRGKTGDIDKNAFKKTDEDQKEKDLMGSNEEHKSNESEEEKKEEEVKVKSSKKKEAEEKPKTKKPPKKGSKKEKKNSEEDFGEI